MIGILTARKIETNFKHEILESIDDIHSGIKILITDIKTISEYDIIGQTDAIIAIVVRKYQHEEAQAVYKSFYNYYIQVNSINDLDCFLAMIEKKELKESSLVTIDDSSKSLIIKGVEIKLTSKEMLIFEYLNNNRGELCLRKIMIKNIFGYHDESETRIIDVYIKYLRTKLGSEGKKIETIRGQGYIYHV